MRPFRIKMKDAEIIIVAKNRTQAFGKFFKKIIDKEISLENIGMIVELYDKNEDYPFRTVPSLFLLGIIEEEVAIASIQNTVNCNDVEAGQMLYKAAEKDKWIVKAATGKPLKKFPPFPREASN